MGKIVRMSEQAGIFGIDLGTTYSVVGYIDETGRAAVTRSSEGQDTTPSVVYFETPENIVVGKVAKESAGVYPDQVVSLIKREMGDKQWRREFFGKEYTPPSISALILGALAKDAETATHLPVNEVVVTVPAYFGLLEKDATKQAGEIAGLDVIGIVPEPVAAALHYGVSGSADGTTFMVYDLGGGTFDVSLIKLTENSVEVLAVGGNSRLGGADWDEKLFDHIVDQLIEQWGDESVRDDEAELQAIRTLTEQVKKDLSKAESKQVIRRYTGTSAKFAVTRKQFEEMTAELLEETIRITNRTLDEAEERYPGIRGQISELLLVGGSSWMPAVGERLKQEFGWEPRLSDPDLAVAKGAALYAAGQTVRYVEASSGTKAGSETIEGLAGSAIPDVIEAAVLSSALVPFVQALAAKSADDVYASLRRLIFRRRPRGHRSAPKAASTISVADKYSKLILQLPPSLDGDMQESLHRLLESLTRCPADPGARWLQIYWATGKTSNWNVNLINEVPAGCIILENLNEHNYFDDIKTDSPKAGQGKYEERIAYLEQERKLLRRMVRYLAADIDPAG